MPTSEEQGPPEVVELVMHREVFERVKHYLETSFPLRVYKMPECAQDGVMLSYGVTIHIPPPPVPEKRSPFRGIGE